MLHNAFGMTDAIDCLILKLHHLQRGGTRVPLHGDTLVVLPLLDAMVATCCYETGALDVNATRQGCANSMLQPGGK